MTVRSHSLNIISFLVLLHRVWEGNRNEGSVNIRVGCQSIVNVLFLLSYEIFKWGFLHDSKRADT